MKSIKNRSGRIISRRKALLRGAGLFTASLFVATGLATQAMAAECEDPAELTFAIVPTEETVAELQLYQPVTKRRAKETGKNGVCFYTPDINDRLVRYQEITNLLRDALNKSPESTGTKSFSAFEIDHNRIRAHTVVFHRLCTRVAFHHGVQRIHVGNVHRQGHPVRILRQNIGFEVSGNAGKDLGTLWR